VADRLRRVATAELRRAEIDAIRALVQGAFDAGEDASDHVVEAFTEDDWDHALGGMHVILEHDGELVSHAAVVERRIRIGHLALRTGYVEAVATAVGRHGRGFGSRVMRDAAAWIVDRFELGALDTGRQSFYERLGWTIWKGPVFVDGPAGRVRMPEEEGHILVLATPSTPTLDPMAPIACEWRPGDVW